ncbi:MAG: hypothetical protein II058_03450, partial [Rhodocyclaceae bacterium]|nr:hypothetical protein [Rhodocyclaceae bacterium]
MLLAPNFQKIALTHKIRKFLLETVFCLIKIGQDFLNLRSQQRHLDFLSLCKQSFYFVHHFHRQARRICTTARLLFPVRRHSHRLWRNSPILVR